MIELRTFGELSVLRDGARVRLGTKKEYALLVYLAVHQGRVMWRDKLISLFWAQSTAARARHSLSQAVYGVRRRLAELVFEAGPDELWLDKGSIGVDVLEFEAALKGDRLDDAVDLYRGGFLDGFWLKDAAGFEEWHELMRNRLDHSARHALLQLVRQAHRAGNWPNTEELARRLLELDPFNEEVHCIRLEAIAAGGDGARAGAEHKRVCALITEELGRQPNPETVALGRRIRQSRVVPRQREDLAADTDSVVSFVGRATEFARLREEWAHAKDGRGRSLLVLGEAGIGKSRLCYHFMRLAALQGARILEARCYPSESRLPYSAAADALLRGLREDDLDALPAAWAAVVSELLPELPSTHANDASIPALDGEGARRRLFEGIARLLHTMSAKSPIFLFIDDFHWADESTAALLHYLARRSRTSAILLVLALRSGEMSSVSRAWLRTDGGPDRVFRKLHVAELDKDAAAQFLTAYEQQQKLEIAVSLRSKVLEQVSGHPLFLVETLNALRNGEIGPDQQTCVAHPDFQSVLPLPASVEDFLRQRFSLLSTSAEQAMAGLAVLGKQVDPRIAQDVSGLPAVSFFQALDELTRKGIIRERGTAVAFSHDMIREAAYHALSGVRRRALHEGAAKTLQREAAPCATLAIHFDLAANGRDAFRYALLAADTAEKIYAYRDAEFFLRMAVANAESDYQRRQIWDRLALFLYRMRRYSEADEFFAMLEEHYRTANNASRLSTARINRAWIWVKVAALPAQELLERLDNLLLVADELDDDAQRSIVLRQRVEVAHDAGEIDVLLSTASRLAELSRDGVHTATAIQALTSAARIFGTYVATDRGLRYSNEAVERAEKAGHPVALIAALVARGTNARQAGLLCESGADFARAMEIIETQAIIGYRNPLLNRFAVLRLEEGRFGEAQQLLSRSEEVAKETGADREMLFIRGNRATLYLEQGLLGRAQHAAEELLVASERISACWHSILAYGTLGLCALERGQRAEAETYRGEILRRFERRGLWGADCSRPEIFLARLWGLEGKAATALARLDRVIRAYEGRDVFCRSRLELERARLLAGMDPQEARRATDAVRTRGVEIGAQPLVEKAERILDQLLLKA